MRSWVIIARRACLLRVQTCTSVASLQRTIAHQVTALYYWLTDGLHYSHAAAVKPERTAAAAKHSEQSP